MGRGRLEVREVLARPRSRGPRGGGGGSRPGGVPLALSGRARRDALGHGGRSVFQEDARFLVVSNYEQSRTSMFSF